MALNTEYGHNAMLLHRQSIALAGILTSAIAQLSCVSSPETGLHLIKFYNPRAGMARDFLTYTSPRKKYALAGSRSLNTL